MAASVIPHFGVGWRTFKAHPGVFIASTLALFMSWVVLEVAVITLQDLGIVVWLILHLAFFFFVSGLIVGFHRLTSTAIEGKRLELSALIASLHRGPTFLLAACIYLIAIVCGLAVLIVPGVYVAVRYALFGYVVATKSVSARESLGIAATLSQGRWWTLFAFLLLALPFNLVGAAFLGVGLILTIPVSLLAASDLYRSLQEPI